MEQTIPGLAAAILVNDAVVWRGALGWADVEHRRPMTIGTVLNVGSVSKLMTSTAVMQLAVVRGLIPILERLFAEGPRRSGGPASD